LLLATILANNLVFSKHYWNKEPTIKRVLLYFLDNEGSSNMERMTLSSIVLHPFRCGFVGGSALTIASLAFALGTFQFAAAQAPQPAPEEPAITATSSQVPWQVDPSSATLNGPTRLSPMVPLRHQKEVGSQFKLQQMQPQLKLQRLPNIAPTENQAVLPPTRLAPLPKVGSAPRSRRNLDWRSPLAPRQQVYYQAQAQPNPPATNPPAGVVERAPMMSNNNQIEQLDSPIGSIADLLLRAKFADTQEEGLPENLAITNMKFQPTDQGELSIRNAIRISGREQTAMWGGADYTWVAPNFSHQPLYFEQPNLERYGHHHGIYQPAISGAHFFSSVALLPYKVGAYRPCEEIYTLGHYRPGDCNPHQYNWLPWSWRGAVFQGLAVTGISVIP
jgi:hypothetical protein